jgi:hypothetical protein
MTIALIISLLIKHACNALHLLLQQIALREYSSRSAELEVSVDVMMSEKNAAVMEVRRAKHAESKAETARHQVQLHTYLLPLLTCHILPLLIKSSNLITNCTSELFASVLYAWYLQSAT